MFFNYKMTNMLSEQVLPLQLFSITCKHFCMGAPVHCLLIDNTVNISYVK